MKLFRYRLLLTILGWLGMLLIALFVVISQLFPMYADTGGRTKVWLILLLLFLAAMLFSAIIGYRIIKIHSMPIENVTETALELVKGNYRARAFEYGTGGTVQLSSTINVLARNLQEITAVRKTEQERLKTLIENMGSALVMIDRQGAISLVNKTFIDEFALNGKPVVDQFYKEIAIPPVLEDFIEHVFMTETSARAQVSFDEGLSTKHLDLYGAPVTGAQETWLGIVIVAHDISELKRLEQVRKDFVANVSHELKTPVTSIKGFTETLLDGAYKDTNSLLAFLEIIQTESNRLEMLIKDLLDLSRVEKADFQVDAKPTDMKEVIEQAEELVQQRLKEKAIRMETELHSVIVHGDPHRLIQVMTNLIVNAITYSTSDTTIRIELFEKEGEAVIHVKDQGIGIEPAEIHRLFERFYRVDRARSRNSGGTGLGLSIVKHLLEAHQGRVEVESTVGVGTTFTIYLPLAQ